MSDGEYQDYDYDDNNDHEDVEEDPEIVLEDHYYQANELLKKEKFQEAKQHFKNILQDAKNADSKSYIIKCVCGLFLIECKQNSPALLDKLKDALNEFPQAIKKDREEGVKIITDHMSIIVDKELYRQSKELFFKYLSGSDDAVRIRGYLRLGSMYSTDKDPVFFEKLLETLKQEIEKSDLSNERIIENKLEMFCLEIQYLQDRSNGKDPRIQEIARAAFLMKTQITDSRISAIIKENIGKMLVHEKNYQKAATELMEAFKDYVRIGDPNAKNILKHAALVGILARDQINPFMQQEAKIYANGEDMQIIQNIRDAFEQKDMKLFERNIDSSLIHQDSFMSSLVDQLKEVVIIQKLKVMTKPYSRLTFGYLSLVLSTSQANIQKYLFKLITEGDLEGRIDTVNGYYEKKTEVNNLLKNQQELIAMFLNSLPRYHAF